CLFFLGWQGDLPDVGVVVAIFNHVYIVPYHHRVSRALKTFHNTTAPNVIVVYLFIVLQIKVHEVCSLHREGSHEYARPSVCPTQDKPIFIELISKNSVDIEEQPQRRPVRRKGSDQHAGRVGIHHLPRLSIAIFICIRSMVQHWVCKWFLWHLW